MGRMENLENLKCKSTAYYQKITSIDVYPVKVEDYYKLKKHLRYNKGDDIVKHHFFKKPTIKKAETDLYEYYGELISPEILATHYGGVFYDDGEFYEKGKVIITISGQKDSEHIYFKSNDDIRAFVLELKNKCEQCGNRLL